MSRIRQCFNRLEQKKERALIAFMMAAMPDTAHSIDCVKALADGGVDLIELGVPFSDPVADGEIIERQHHQGVARGLNLEKVLDYAVELRRATDIPTLLFCYYNPVYQRGIPRLMKEMGEIGIDGIIIPDLPLDEMGPLAGYPISPIPLATPGSSKQRLDMAAAMNPDFVYCVSVKGVTGERSLPEAEINRYLEDVRATIQRPLALGFGISGPEQIESFKQNADAFVVGSHFARIMTENDAHPLSIPAKLAAEAARMKLAAHL